jgi:hypothetical protein
MELGKSRMMSQFEIDAKTINDRLKDEETLQELRIRQGLVSAISIKGAVHIFCFLFGHF